MKICFDHPRSIFYVNRDKVSCDYADTSITSQQLAFQHLVCGELRDLTFTNLWLRNTIVTVSYFKQEVVIQVNDYSIPIENKDEVTDHITSYITKIYFPLLS